MALRADTYPAYELDFIQNEAVTIQKNNLLPEQAARDYIYNKSFNNYPKMDKTEFKKLVDNAEIILVEEITPVDARIISFYQYYYSVQVKAKDGRLLAAESIDAQTGKRIDAIFFSGISVDENGTEKKTFAVLLDRSEIIAYVKKYFTFPAESKITLCALYDYSFYYDICLPNQSTNWKYRITIEDGLFESTAYPEGITTLFISPYTKGYNDKKEEPAPANDIVTPLTHRIYTYQSAVKSQTQTTANKALPVASPADTYVGLD